MKSPEEKSLKKIRNFHKEIRRIEREISSLEENLEQGISYSGYWPESRLYSAPAEKKKKYDARNSELNFVVPWQMEQ